MKTFKDEYKKLWDWRVARFEVARKLPGPSLDTGLDGSKRCRQDLLDDKEYRRRLQALQKKYNRVPQPTPITAVPLAGLQELPAQMTELQETAAITAGQ